MIALHRAYELSAISGWSKTSTLLTTNIRTDAVYNSIPLTNLPQGEDANPDEFGAFFGAKFAMTADCTDLLCSSTLFSRWVFESLSALVKMMPKGMPFSPSISMNRRGN